MDVPRANAVFSRTGREKGIAHYCIPTDIRHIILREVRRCQLDIRGLRGCLIDICGLREEGCGGYP